MAPAAFLWGWGMSACLAALSSGQGMLGDLWVTPLPPHLPAPFPSRRGFMPSSLIPSLLLSGCRRRDDKTKMNGPGVPLCLSASCLIN